MSASPSNSPQMGESASTQTLNMKNPYYHIRLLRLPITYCLLSVVCCQLSIGLFAQSSKIIPKQKIAVFAPLYLDSAFDKQNNYRYDKNFPKFIIPGLEFYEGVKLALDSLNKEGIELEVFVFDTRSSKKSVLEQLQQMDSVNMIIAFCTAHENYLFAGEAMIRKIPYINPNLPNDGGITNNPYFVLLNSTLKTHVEELYRFAQKKYANSSIVLFRKKGELEDLIRDYINDFANSLTTAALKIKWVELNDDFNIKQLVNNLDSTRHIVCISGTLDDQFNRRLALYLASIHKIYKTTMIGMPTLENTSKDFYQQEFRGPEFIYSTPFYNPRKDSVSQRIINYFNEKMYARPSDMVLRGYETAWRFSKLLIRYKKDIASNLTSYEFNVFREIDIRPVINKQTLTLDYFENKKLYFLKWQDGVIKEVY